MEEISLPKIQTQKEDQFYGQFIIEPFYPGYGSTIGNALRRVLVSSLEGAAISRIKIQEATHEFSAILGIKEDMVEIVLNLKKIRLKLYGEESATLKLTAKGPKVINASDIKTPAQVEIINGDQHIATLDNSKATLNIEMVVEKGRGYMAAEEKPENSEIGVIQIDSLFSPVTWVNFKSENTRVGQRTDFNKVTVEIKTDGTILPSEALKKAVDILINQFNVLTKIESKIKPKTTTKTSKKIKKTKHEKKDGKKTSKKK